MLRQGLLFLSESSAARRLITGTPLTRGLSRRFVAGETVDELVDAVRAANAEGLTATANYLGESVKSEEAARAAADRYVEVLERIRRDGLDANVSLKFTQMGQNISDTFLRANLGRVLEQAQAGGIFVRFDMESSDYTDRTLSAFRTLWSEGVRDIGVVLQSYLRRTQADVERMVDLGARVRLCKGAYAEPERLAYQDREEVRASFVRAMEVLLSRGHYPGIATHDDAMIRATVEYAKREGIGADRFEFQMLHGVRRDLQQQLVAQGWRVRVYIPFGEAWYPYLMRRLAERPANVVFLAGSVLKESPLGSLFGNHGRDGR